MWEFLVVFSRIPRDLETGAAAPPTHAFQSPKHVLSAQNMPTVRDLGMNTTVTCLASQSLHPNRGSREHACK